MNKQEANEWLKQVKGMKIRRAHWGKGLYIAPTGEWKYTPDDNPHYWEFWAIGDDGEKDWYFIRNGFKESENGVKWVPAETFDDYLEMYHKED